MPDREVWAFGSRAKWTAKDASDLDIAIIGNIPLGTSTLVKLNDDLSESGLPIKVDIVDWATTSENFRKIIEEQKVILKLPQQSRGWRMKQLGDVADIIAGGTPSTQDDENFQGDIPWLTPKDLSGYQYRRISHGERNISEKGLKNSSARLLPKNSILLTSRAPIGYLAIADNPIATNQGFKSLVLHEGYDPDFVYYLLKNNVDLLKAHATGTTFLEVSGSVLKNISLSFPEYQEQILIGKILSTLDDKIELNRRMNETLEATARAIFKSWFIDFDPVHAKAEGRQPFGMNSETAALFPDSFEESELGMIPKGWGVGNIDEFCTISSGKRPESKVDVQDAENIIPIFGGAGQMGFAKRALIDRPILLTGRVGTLGIIHKILTPIWPSDNTLIISPKSDSFLNFLYFLFKDINILILNRGSTQPLLTQTDLNNQRVIIPSIKIVNLFSSHVEGIFKKIDKNNAELGILAKIRDVLLPKLLSGQISLPTTT